MSRNIVVKPIVYCESLNEIVQFILEPFTLYTYNNFWQSPYFYEMLGIEADGWVKNIHPFITMQHLGMPVNLTLTSLHYTDDFTGCLRILDFSEMPHYHTIWKPYRNHGYILRINCATSRAQKHYLSSMLDIFAGEVYRHPL